MKSVKELLMWQATLIHIAKRIKYGSNVTNSMIKGILSNEQSDEKD